MDPGASCPGPSGNITQYNIRFETGSVVNTESVNIARCTARRCNHTFVPPSNPPSSYDSVSVAAENVVGVGPARNLLIQPICKLKFPMFYFENTETIHINSCICAKCTEHMYSNCQSHELRRCMETWLGIAACFFCE